MGQNTKVSNTKRNKIKQNSKYNKIQTRQNTKLICILLHLYFVTFVFWQFVFCSFVFCRVCILEFLYFVLLYFVSFGCILFCLYYGTFVFCHGFKIFHPLNMRCKDSSYQLSRNSKLNGICFVQLLNTLIAIHQCLFQFL